MHNACHTANAMPNTGTGTLRLMTTGSVGAYKYIVLMRHECLLCAVYYRNVVCNLRF